MHLSKSDRRRVLLPAGVAAIAIVSVLSTAWAQGLGPQKEAPSQPQAQVPAGAIMPMITHCYTNVRDCAGTAPFVAGNTDWSCTIFWNNGANGHSNFTLRSGQTNYENVRYNDTAACVGGLNGGSETATRYWIWVP